MRDEISYWKIRLTNYLFPKVFKWTLDSDRMFPEFDRAPKHKKYYVRTKNKRFVAKLDSTGLRVYSGFSWDGCSPKMKFFGHLIGVWDGPKVNGSKIQRAYIPSMLHDVLLQMHGHYLNFPYTREEIDKIFYNKLREHLFPFPRLYYWFVRLWTKYRRQNK